MLQWLDAERREEKDSFSATDNALERAYEKNAFFTPYMQRFAVRAIAEKFLNSEELNRFVSNYHLRFQAANCGESAEPSTKVGIIAAGNIPLVVFHDFLCSVACGCNVIIKLSSKDNLLFPALLNLLFEINPFWREKIDVVENLPHSEINMLLFMGSTSTADKILSEYPDIPLLLRKSRFSYALITGRETVEELERLGEDVFMYFGLGCRSVTTLMLPMEYDIEKIISALQKAGTFVADRKFTDIYIRNKALAVMEGDKFADGGFFIIKECSPVNLPIGVLNIVRYCSYKDIEAFDKNFESQIQKKYCIFGEAQRPGIFEYPDNTDTVDFILNHLFAGSHADRIDR